jgi:hypothetical protein
LRRTPAVNERRRVRARAVARNVLTMQDRGSVTPSGGAGVRAP